MSNSKFYDVICANECRNTHHKLVMNSLKHLTCPDAEKWRSVFIKYFEYYLQGSKDPDTRFKDFRNHVLHVSDNYWGGAVGRAEKWYGLTVDHLTNQRWKPAVYSAGVLSHYYMDPLMPLHTGQTEEEGVIHRACEWSVNKSFKSLIELLEKGRGYPNVVLPTGDDWLQVTIHQGAALAHKYYPAFIDHYNLEIGAKDPPAGLDEHLRDVTSQLLGFASVSFARILERAFVESGATPTDNSNSLMKLFYQLTIPVSWSFKAARHISGRRQVQKVAAEFQRTGKVVKSLSRDEKEVRKLHAEEILKVDLKELDARPINPVGSKSTANVKPQRKKKQKTKRTGTSQFHLNPNEPLEQAPSIGVKTAQHFKEINIETVEQFLAANPETIATALNNRHIPASTIRLWQTQARLVCEIPRIYGHDAQILAACGFESPEEIAQAEPEMVLSLVGEFAKTQEAKFVIRNGTPPDLKEVTNWIEWSRQSRRLKAA